MLLFDRIVDDETRKTMEQLLNEQADRLLHIDADGDKLAEITAQIDCLTPDMYGRIISIEPVLEPATVSIES